MSKQFKLVVFETRVIEMVYTVEADTDEEAWEMASDGETIEESFVRDLSVSNREVQNHVEDGNDEKDEGEVMPCHVCNEPFDANTRCSCEQLQIMDENQ